MLQCRHSLRVAHLAKGLSPRNASARCLHSTSHLQQASRDPNSIAETFLSRFSKDQKFVRKQLLDANQLRLLSLTLDRPHLWPASSENLEEKEPADGTPLPPGYHLAFFTPAQRPGLLGQDGTDTSFNPDSPFTRRMWAGGSVHWPGTDVLKGSNPCYLRVGEEATEITKVLSCESKTIRKTGESMLVVGVEKEFRNGKEDLCVIDRRNWVFREALDPQNPASVLRKPRELSAEELDDQAKGKLVKDFNRDVATLFRFSALTFNGHRIHYDKPWAVNVEGHRDVVVHGPLNLISMLDIWRDEAYAQSDKSAEIHYPKEIKYRAKSPLYAGEGYRILMDDSSIGAGKNTDVHVVSRDGTTCMEGTIQSW